MVHLLFKPVNCRNLWAFLLLLFFLAGVFGTMAPAQEFQPDPSLQPLTESSQQTPVLSKNQQFLEGRITTLESALKDESETVDWYAWYLSCREYLISTQGLRCSAGTPLRIYKNGRFEALTSNPDCLASAASKYFPLPRETVLKAVLLPVRGREDAPATREEIDMRTQPASVK